VNSDEKTRDHLLDAALALLLALLSLGLRWAFFPLIEHLDQESIYRVAHSMEWVHRPLRLLIKPWYGISGSGGQDGFYLLNALMIGLFGEPVAVTRIISLVFGSASAIPCYLLCRIGFSRGVAVASTAALAVYVQHVQLSVVPMGQAGCLFFLLWSLYFLARSFDARTRGAARGMLAVSAVSLLLSTWFRMEADLLVLVIPVFLLARGQRREALVFLAISSLYMLQTLVHGWLITGIPFPAAARNTLNIRTSINPEGRTVIGWQWELLPVYLFILSKYLGWPLVALAAAGSAGALIGSGRRSAAGLVSVSFLCYLAAMNVRSAMSEFPPFPRYSVLLGALAFPLAFAAVEWIARTLLRPLSQKRRVIERLAVPVILLAVVSALGVRSIRILADEVPNLRYSDRARSVLQFMEQNLEPGDLVMYSLDPVDVAPGFVAKKMLAMHFDFADMAAGGQAEIGAVLSGLARELKLYHLAAVPLKGDTLEIRRVLFVVTPVKTAPIEQALSDRSSGLLKQTHTDLTILIFNLDRPVVWEIHRR